MPLMFLKNCQKSKWIPILFILTSFNFVTISPINCWDHVNLWKNWWKFWNGPLSRKKPGLFPLLNVSGCWKSSNTKACAKKLSQIIANNVNNRGRGIGLRIYVRYYRLVLFKFHRSFFASLCSQFNNTFNKNFTVISLLLLSQWQTSKSSLSKCLSCKESNDASIYQMISPLFYFQPSLNRFFRHCIKLFTYIYIYIYI